MKFKLNIRDVVKAILFKLAHDKPDLEGKEAEVAVKARRVKGNIEVLYFEVEVLE